MATFNYNKVNLAAAQIPSAITASQTSITVDASESALFPTVPFFATIMPAGGVPNTINYEIVQVTAINTTSGVLTIARAQRGTTAKAQDEGAVIMNGVYIEDLAQAQAVGKSFFSATLSSSVYYIQDARLTTTPENGDSIRVVFGSNWTSGTPKLSLNSGTSYNIYAGNNLTASHGTTNTPAMVKSGIIYELTYYNGAWYILNLTANSSITSDNVDWATFDTGWLDCLYYSGFKTGSNTEWSKLQARLCFGQLTLRGSVSRTSGNLDYGKELKVAKLPDSIKTIFAATTNQHLNGLGSSSGGGVSMWTILGKNVSAGSVGDITVSVHAFLGGSNTGRAWASPPSIGTTIVE